MYKNVLVTAGFMMATMLCSHAGEIHVSKSGHDSNEGTEVAPFLTISKAATVAMPGDTVIVQEGTYREWVQPSRGGDGDDQRITYCAAPNANVEVKGSEQISSWVDQGNGTWKAEVPNSLFGDYNPYELTVDGKWMEYGNWHHRGAVYLEGVAFYEVQAPLAVIETESSWWCSVGASTTTLIANFGGMNPNENLTEINVRESIFMPTISGLDYITVRGLNIRHAAPHWAPPTLTLQMGAIGPRMGKSWVIEHCEITDSRNVGIILGIAPGYSRDNLGGIDGFGDHLIRNNIIRRCGQSGIAGEYGATRCLITKNLVEETNHLEEFGGYETAAIKFHHSVDLTISGNLIRGVYGTKAAYGLWIDYENQGTRITGNIIYNTDMWGIYLEMNHGPILIDNNIFFNEGIRAHSSSSAVMAHNLFIKSKMAHTLDNTRRPYAWEPHTTIAKPTKLVVNRDNKWFNNITIGNGLGTVNDAIGYEADYNLYLDTGASKSSFGDVNSVLDTGFNAPYSLQSRPLGATISFTVNDAPEWMTPDRVTGDLVGYFEYAGQTIEDRFGNPISIDYDFNGEEFTTVKVGPLATIQTGVNTINWDFEFQEDPSVEFALPSEDLYGLPVGSTLSVVAKAADLGGTLSQVVLFKDGVRVRAISDAPYSWGAGDALLENLTEGDYEFRLRADYENGTRVDAYRSVSVLNIDLDPPTPNPSQWVSAEALSATEIEMVAETASDPNGVSYFFQFTTGTNAWRNSGWVDSPVFVASDLLPNSEYKLYVVTRDGEFNRGSWSSVTRATTWSEADVDAPTPNPLQWVSVEPLSSTEIEMVAETASDPNGVEYSFYGIVDGAAAFWSGWIADSSYTATDLNPETTYTMWVQTRDSLGNVGEWSPAAQGTTLASIDTEAPTPSPSQWVGAEALSATEIEMTAVTATDPSGVYYLFNYRKGSDSWTSSGWGTSPVFVATDLAPNSEYTMYVITEDGAGNRGSWSAPQKQTTL